MWQNHEESFKGLSKGKMAPVCQDSLDGNKETYGLKAGFWCWKNRTHIITRLYTIERETGSEETATALSDKDKGGYEAAGCMTVILNCYWG